MPVEEIQTEDIHLDVVGQGISISNSLGIDPSVDSMALEGYDYVEPVHRLM